MREISVLEIEQAVRDLCIQANRYLPTDVCEAITCAQKQERMPLAREILCDLEENITVAKTRQLPVCQDTGMAVVFVELGQEVHIAGGLLEEAIHRGVSRGYTEGLLRCSVVSDPLERVNTNDNTPAVIHLSLVAGDALTLTVAPKGFGSENMSRLYMLTPAQATKEDIIAHVVKTVREAGSNPCPPVVLGVGIGGDFELCPLLAKRALCRPFDQAHPNTEYAALEKEILAAVNALGIGPQGFGGDTTALHVAIETYPTHIAGLPLAVNVGCHVTRHATITI